MKTGEQYKASLRDGREVYFDGEQVADVPSHPVLGQCAERAARGYDVLYSPAPDATSPLLRIPTSADELREHAEVVHAGGLMAHVTYTSVMTMLTTAAKLPAGPYRDRIAALVEHIQAEDLRVVQCITDAKGNRARRPSEQHDPDAYLHVVDRTRQGVIVRGAKLHITGASLGHELLTIPTKGMRGNEAEYAIACLVPVQSPGVRIVDVTSAGLGDDRDHPVSRQVHYPDGFVIFDDVFVPNERIMLDGEVGEATLFAHSLGLWERVGGLSSVAEEADVLVGLAQLIAEANGTAGIHHVKEKIGEMMVQATLIRASLEAALSNCRPGFMGAVFPDELFTNAGKYFAVKNYGVLLRNLQDIAGGSTVTAPRSADLDNDVVGPLIRKYMAGAAPDSGEYRTRLFHAIRDATADAYGGWKQVARLNGGGGLFAQLTVTRKHYDLDRAKAAALASSGLSTHERSP